MSCPICKRASDQKYRPFCSNRCAEVDLGRWLTGAYAIPTDEPGTLDSPSDASAAPSTDEWATPGNTRLN
ncbi:MAG: DNA gyrase inhibitor YacG [Paracoccaceae bacterium]|jgi:uncharacterized protein|nr:DNA gyrase inhibitor YacG [Paracoccaceae bacterium]